MDPALRGKGRKYCSKATRREELTIRPEVLDENRKVGANVSLGKHLKKQRANKTLKEEEGEISTETRKRS